MNRASSIPLILSLSGIALLAFLVGCSPQEKNDQTDKKWINEKEITALKNMLSEILEENRSQRCPRPVLRGTPIEGPAEEDMKVVLDLEEELSTCRKLLADKSEGLSEVLFFPEGKTRTGYPVRSGLTSRLLDDPRANTKDVSEIEKACVPIVGRIDKAVSHGDACNPDRPGLGDAPLIVPSYIYFLRGSKGAVAVARKLLSNGEVLDAVQLMLDFVRLGHDISRRSRSLIAPIIAAYVTRSAVSFLELAFNQRPEIGRDSLRQINAELAILLSTEPHPGKWLRGELMGYAHYFLTPFVTEPGWAPERGWSHYYEYSHEEYPIHLHEFCGLGVMTMMELYQELEKLCPLEATIEQCHLGLVSFVEEKTGLKEINREGSDWLTKFLLARDATTMYRRLVLDIYKASWASSMARYVAHYGWGRFYLAALRLMVRYRLMAEASRTCPGISAFDKEPLLSLRPDPYSGGKIKVEKHGGKLLVLRSPAPMGKQAGQDAEPALVIECPY
jgi:hypothetical protein